MPTETPSKRSEWPGYAILGGLVLVALMIFNITALGDLTRDRFDVVAVLSSAEGVRVGSRVRVSGVQAGRVTEIRIMPRGDSVFVALRLRLDGATRDVIRLDSDVRAVRLRVIGEPLIAVLPGSAGAPEVTAGDTLWPPPRASPRRVLEQGLELPGRVDSLLVAARRLQEMAELRARDFALLQARFDAVATAGRDLTDRMAGGSLGAFLDDPGFGGKLTRLGARVGELSAALDAAIERYAPGDGESELAVALAGLRARTDEVRHRLDRLEAGLEGGTGSLFRFAEDGAIQRDLAGVQAQMDSLRAEAVSIGLRMILPW